MQPPVSQLSPDTTWCSHPYRVAVAGHLCATIIGALPSLNRSGSALEYEVYIARSPDPLTVLGYGGHDIVRFTTNDFKAWSSGKIVYTFDPSL